MIGLFFKKCALNLLLLILSPIFLIFLLPIYAFRLFVGKVVILCCPKIDKILTTGSSVFGADAIYKRPKSSLVAVFIAEGTMSLEKVRESMMTRVVEARLPNGRLRKPEFQQYVTSLCGFVFWKWEDQFDIKEHVNMYNGKFQNQFLNGTKEVNTEATMDISDELAYSPFRPKTSPWQVYLVHNYREPDKVTGAPVGPISTVFIFHVHHSLGDGFSIIKVLSVDMTETKLETAQPKYVQPKGTSMICKSLNFIVSAPYELLTDTLSSIDVNSWHVPEEQLKRTANIAISYPLPMDYLKEVKNLHKVSFTALIIECFTAASRKFMMEADFTVPETIHCITPLPVPGHPDKMRNHMTACVTTLPVGMSDPRERLDSIEKNLIHLKSSTFPTAWFKLLPLIGGLFRRMISVVAKNDKTTALMSNFPGPNNAISIDGHKIVGMWFSGGLLEGNCGMGFSSLSYNGSIRIIAGMDEGIVSKNSLPAKKLLQYFLEEIEILRKEAV